MTTPNPELMLACAKMAYPEHEWLIDQGKVVRIGAVNHCVGLIEFEYSDADAFWLERSLKKEVNGWWDFGEDRNRTGLYEAHSPKYPENIKDPSDTLLLIKCVSAQTNIPLEAP
jgi:hypothetical protein